VAATGDGSRMGKNGSERDEARVDRRREPKDELEPLAGLQRPGSRVREVEAMDGVLIAVGQNKAGNSRDLTYGIGFEGAYPAAQGSASSLTPEQENILLEHLPVVRYLARRIHERLPQHVEIEDLVSAGVVGLMDAFAKFDPDKKVQFRSYAQFRIRGAIIDSLRTLDWSPRELRRKGRAVEEAIRVLTSRLGRAPGEAEIAAELGLNLEEYQQLLGDLKGLEIGTLHIEHNEDSGEEELAYIPGRPDEDPLFCCLRSELEDRLGEAINHLPDRERLVMTLYYYEEMTMREIGLALGVVESRVSQVHASAVVHLRAGLKDLTGSGAFDRARNGAAGARAGRSGGQGRR
jgi:RNA polymerase sigma factor for flagellar operon FliA